MSESDIPSVSPLLVTIATQGTKYDNPDDHIDPARRERRENMLKKAKGALNKADDSQVPDINPALVSIEVGRAFGVAALALNDDVIVKRNDLVLLKNQIDELSSRLEFLLENAKKLDVFHVEPERVAISHGVSLIAEQLVDRVRNNQ